MAGRVLPRHRDGLGTDAREKDVCARVVSAEGMAMAKKDKKHGHGKGNGAFKPNGAMPRTARRTGRRKAARSRYDWARSTTTSGSCGGCRWS